MIVYYVATEEKPKKSENIKFFTSYSSAVTECAELRGSSVYSFNVNDKCDTNSFGMDTIMVFSKDLETGKLKFLASGKWLELHEILNIPFYYDFESRSKTFVSMSLKYFNSNYTIIPKTEDMQIKDVSDLIDPGDSETEHLIDKGDSGVSIKQQKAVIDEDILSDLFS